MFFGGILMKKNVKGTPYILSGIVLPFVIFVCFAVILAYSVSEFGIISKTQGKELTLSSIRKATVQCFADEGRFPPDIDYLIERYGIDPDTENYRIVYDCVASNVFPNIEVYNRTD